MPPSAGISPQYLTPEHLILLVVAIGSLILSYISYMRERKYKRMLDEAKRQGFLESLSKNRARSSTSLTTKDKHRRSAK